LRHIWNEIIPEERERERAVDKKEDDCVLAGGIEQRTSKERVDYV
jgi:hypothetical protein